MFVIAITRNPPTRMSPSLFLEDELAYTPADPLVQLLESVAAGGGSVVPYPSLHELLQLFQHLSDRDSAVPLGDSANGLLELRNGLRMRGQSRSGSGSGELEPEEFQSLRGADFRLLPVDPELQVLLHESGHGFAYPFGRASRSDQNQTVG